MMETEAIRQQMNSALVLEDWRLHNEYKSVSALLLYWQVSIEPGFEAEAHMLGELFAKGFNYHVDYFQIPMEISHGRLDAKINSLLDDHEDPDHLLIIYYGGHGDPNNDGAEKQLAVWAAWVLTTT